MPTPPTNNSFAIRSFRAADTAACRTLYLAGLLGGKLAENDTALDMDDIEGTYLRPGNHFWVATSDAGDIVGMIGVQHFEEATGEIRRLRVRLDHRGRGIGSTLIETAIRFCLEHQYLKVVLDTYMDREPAMELFKKFNFRHERTRPVGGRELLVFYFDLYTQPQRKKKE
jgi:ribosomal protein S18 acetylase RimI-like enzyme